MKNDISAQRNPLAWLASTAKDKDLKARIRNFLAWQEARAPWYQPDLAAYRDALLAHGLSPMTVSSYLSSIRGAYRQVLKQNNLSEILCDAISPNASPEAYHTFVTDTIRAIQHAIHPSQSPIVNHSVALAPSSDDVRLSIADIEHLLTLPGTETLVGLRDTAILAMLVCTGIREDELCSIHVEDLRIDVGGELALRVRLGKHNKERLIPYGALRWCLDYVDAWLEAANITEGPAFRGFYPRGGIRPGGLTTRSIQIVVKLYPIVTSTGQRITVLPSDLRTFYTREKFRSYIDIHSIDMVLTAEAIENR